jgi:site-specific DNA recombinase
VIIDRVIDGMEKKASTGQWTLGVPPYGYTVDPTTRHLRQIPEEAAVVREIFGLYTARRIGTRAIANELTQCGYRRRSGRPWSSKTVTDTLRNPAYLGTVAFRDVRAEDASSATPTSARTGSPSFRTPAQVRRSKTGSSGRRP